jgi:hypothetical protein
MFDGLFASDSLHIGFTSDVNPSAFAVLFLAIGLIQIWRLIAKIASGEE